VRVCVWVIGVLRRFQQFFSHASIRWLLVAMRRLGPRDYSATNTDAPCRSHRTRYTTQSDYTKTWPISSSLSFYCVGSCEKTTIINLTHLGIVARCWLNPRPTDCDVYALPLCQRSGRLIPASLFQFARFFDCPFKSKVVCLSLGRAIPKFMQMGKLVTFAHV